jgi:hypothetical protein
MTLAVEFQPMHRIYLVCLLCIRFVPCIILEIGDQPYEGSSEDDHLM